jgi:hypothetical protein
MRLLDSGFIHVLDDPWAPHPVVNKHICCGGGGGETFTQQTPNVPDYTQFIKAMSDIGNQGQSWARDLYNWAQSTGVNLQDIAKTVSSAAGAAATRAGQWAQDAYGRWQRLSAPLYEAQQADAMRMIGNLPQTEEEYAGKFGSDAAMSADQQKQAAIRDMERRGLAPNAAATGALDTMASTNRALATTAAAESGRLAARNEARQVTGQALTSEQTLPQVAQAQQGIETQNLALQTQAPNAAATASSGLYSPAMGMYSAAYPYMNAWGSTMANSYNEQLQGYNASLNAFKANQEAASQGSGAGALLGLAGGIAGSFLGPAGSAVGSAVGKAAGSAITGGGGYTGGPFGASGGSIFGGLAEGGKIRGRRIRFAKGGAIDTGSPMDQGHLVPPEASPSGGQNVDDVNAMVSEGEFVVPERTVDWYGEKFFQNLINKADKEAETQTVAEGEEKPVPQAIMAQPPMFRSEGART